MPGPYLKGINAGGSSNNLVRLLEKKLNKKGYITKVDPRISNDGNQLRELRISDLIAWESKNTSKVQKYDDKDIHIWTTNNSPSEFPPPKVYVTAFVCNWRGVISSKSYSSWRGIGFFRSMLMNLSTTALSGTYLMWKHHKRKTQKRWRKGVGMKR